MNTSISPIFIPYLAVQNAKNTIDFYEKAFGFSLVSTEPLENAPEQIGHVEMRYKNAIIMFCTEATRNYIPARCPKTSGVCAPVTFCVLCDDVDAFYNHAVNAGAVSFMEPHDTHWGDRMCGLYDIDGFTWMFLKKMDKN